MAKTPTANPFTPLFGQMPLYVAGRQSFLDEMERAFRGAGNDPGLSSLIVGPRGTGKTVLLTSVADLAEKNGWICSRVSAAPGMLEDILQRAWESASHLVSSPDSRTLTGIEVGGMLSLAWENDAPQANWRTRMNLLFDALLETQTGLLIAVDELNPSLDELIVLATTYQHFLSEGKRVSLVMAGLPGNVSGLLNGKSTSFWRRAHKQHLERISDEDVSSALVNTLAQSGKSISSAALETATESIGGFAYMIQLVGYWSFERSLRHDHDSEITKADVIAGVERASNELRNSVLEATFAELSDGDVRFLSAMLLSDGPTTMRDIAERMGTTQGYASQYRLRLISRGVIGPRGRGKLDFEIPFMREYVRECAEFDEWPATIERGAHSGHEWAQAAYEIHALWDSGRH